MNHIADANKMVSDTPRTDAAEKHAYEFKDEYIPVCESKLVRQLERELNAANQIIRQQQLLEEENLRLTAKVAQFYQGAEEQKLRIKWLEEAGDYIVEENDIYIGKEVWRKAKEDKL